MTCETGTWSIRFPSVAGTDGPFEIIPTELNFTRTRGDFSIARGVFEPEIGGIMKPHTRFADGALNRNVLVEVLHDGEPVYTLYFKPDFASYGQDKTFIEFHDAQETLDSGVCDKQWSVVTLREAYEYAFEQRTDESLVSELKFSVPDEVPTKLIGQQVTRHRFNRRMIRRIEQDSTERLAETAYAIDFDKISPLKAIWMLNRKFRVTSWVDSDGVLWVGFPEAMSNYHIAAEHDTRVWRYDADEVQIKHPREPLQQVHVEGAWVDDPGLDTDVVKWFNKGGTGDVRAVGVAYRTDIDYGESISYTNMKAKRNALPGIAEAIFRERMKDANSGTVQIDTAFSGDFTDPAKVTPGDLIHLVPDDDYFVDPQIDSGEVGDEPDIDPSCGFVNNELYFVKEVQHDISHGFWSLTLDVGMYPDEVVGEDAVVDSTMRYFDPKSEEYLYESEVYDGNWIEDDG